MLLALLYALAAAPPDPHGCFSPPNAACRAAAEMLVTHLDLSSFPNSTGPRRDPAKHTFADYGFVKVRTFDDGWTELSEADGGWAMNLYMLRAETGRAEICLTDVAHNGGTYQTTSALEVRPGPNGLWRATGRKVVTDACRETPSR